MKVYKLFAGIPLLSFFSSNSDVIETLSKKIKTLPSFLTNSSL